MPQVFLFAALPHLRQGAYFLSLQDALVPYRVAVFRPSNFVAPSCFSSGFVVCGTPHLPVAASVEICHFSMLEFCRMQKRAFVKDKRNVPLSFRVYFIFFLFFK